MVKKMCAKSRLKTPPPIFGQSLTPFQMFITCNLTINNNKFRATLLIIANYTSSNKVSSTTTKTTTTVLSKSKYPSMGSITTLYPPLHRSRYPPSSRYETLSTTCCRKRRDSDNRLRPPYHWRHVGLTTTDSNVRLERTGRRPILLLRRKDSSTGSAPSRLHRHVSLIRHPLPSRNQHQRRLGVFL